MQSVIKSSVVFIGCEVLSKAVPFLLLPYFTRVLSPDSFGELGLFTSLQALCIILVSFSFDGAIARYFYKYGGRNLNTLIYHSFMFILFLTISLFFIIKISPWDSKIIEYALFTSSLQAMFNVLLTSKQCQKKTMQYAFYQVCFSLISALTTVAAFVFFDASVRLRVFSLELSLGVLIIIFILLTRARLSSLLSLRLLKLNLLYFISFGLPLIVHQLSLYVKGQFDRVLIAHSFTLSELASYTAAFQLASCLNVIIMALNKALVPYYFEACKKGSLYTLRVKRWFLISIPLSLIPGGIFLFIPPWVYTFILGNAYSQVSHTTALFVIGLCLQIPYLLVVNFMFYNNNNKRVAIVTFSASLVHLCALFFLKNLGANFLPLALIISNATCLLMLFFIGFKSNE